MKRNVVNRDVQALTQRMIDRLVAEGHETGLQVAAYLDGEPVVNAWAGLADASTGLARMYAALVGEVDGVRLISAERAATVSTVVTAGTDRVLGAPIPKGLGYFLGLPEMGPKIGAFGCKGSGGSIAFADPESRFSFALTHNRLTAPPADNAGRIADRIREALGIGGNAHIR